MGSYLMMLYVTLEQESALKSFFVEQNWPFCKPDLSVITDKVGPVTPRLSSDTDSHIEAEDHVTTEEVPVNETPTDIHKRQPCVIKIPLPISKASTVKQSKKRKGKRKTRSPRQPTKPQKQAKLAEYESAVGDVTDTREKQNSEGESQESSGKIITPVLVQMENGETIQIKIEQDGAEREKVVANTDEADADDDFDDVAEADDPDYEEENDGDESLEDTMEKEGDVSQVELPDDGLTPKMSTNEEEQPIDAIAEEQEIDDDQPISCGLKVETAADDILGEEVPPLDGSFQEAKEYSADNECSICSKKYQSKSSLTRHVRVTHCDNVIKCTVCQKVFESEDVKTAHVLDKHARKFICSQCGSSFKMKCHLNEHIRYKHSPDDMLKCPVANCGRKFVRKQVFQDHMNQHNNCKPYTCRKCSKSFSSQHSLKRHELMCVYGKTFKCNECSKEYTDSSSLKYHVEGAHRKERFICGCGAFYRYQPSLLKHKKQHNH